MIAYSVSYSDSEGERYRFPIPHLFKESAQSHERHLLKAGATDPRISQIEMSSIARQKVLIAGDVAGYQFSATTMGKRTVTRKVYNIKSDEDGSLRGKVKWKERVLEVVLEDWLRDRWVAVKNVGYIGGR